MQSTMQATRPPIRGPEYDKNRPETRQPWLDFRSGGITATEIRDWGNPKRRREILVAKVTGDGLDLTGNPYVDHGNIREPFIASWIRDKFGIEPCNAVYARADNPRHLASPDGITVDPFSGELMFGAPEAWLSEIKTSVHDLTPGTLDENRVLVAMARGSEFEKSGYYVQMQWQMYVMDAARTLFVWERHSNFTPVLGTPQWCWIPRDEELIAKLVGDVAPKALEQIDSARAANIAGELPMASELPSEHAALVQDYLTSLEAEKIAAAKKTKAWNALKAIYLAEGEPDVSIDAGFALVSVTTSEKPSTYVDVEAMKKKAPALIEKYETLRQRYTKTETKTSRTFNVTARTPKEQEKK